MTETQNYNEKQAVVLQFIKIMKKFYGSTRLQKIIFLYQQEKCIRPNFFNYEPYYYGPYSKEVQEILEDLIDQDLVEENLVENRTKDDFYTTFSLTHEGISYLDEVKEFTTKKEIREIHTVVSAYGYLSQKDLLRKAYEYKEFTTKSIIKEDL